MNVFWFRSLNESLSCKLEKINKCQAGFFSVSTFCYLRKIFNFINRKWFGYLNRDDSSWFERSESDYLGSELNGQLARCCPDRCCPVDEHFEIFIACIVHKHSNSHLTALNCMTIIVTNITMVTGFWCMIYSCDKIFES